MSYKFVVGGLPSNTLAYAQLLFPAIIASCLATQTASTAPRADTSPYPPSSSPQWFIAAPRLLSTPVRSTTKMEFLWTSKTSSSPSGMPRESRSLSPRVVPMTESRIPSSASICFRECAPASPWARSSTSPSTARRRPPSPPASPSRSISWRRTTPARYVPLWTVSYPVAHRYRPRQAHQADEGALH